MEQPDKPVRKGRKEWQAQRARTVRMVHRVRKDLRVRTGCQVCRVQPALGRELTNELDAAGLLAVP
jgi:hypothetical protein